MNMHRTHAISAAPAIPHPIPLHCPAAPHKAFEARPSLRLRHGWTASWLDSIKPLCCIVDIQSVTTDGRSTDWWWCRAAANRAGATDVLTDGCPRARHANTQNHNNSHSMAAMRRQGGRQSLRIAAYAESLSLSGCEPCMCVIASRWSVPSNAPTSYPPSSVIKSLKTSTVMKRRKLSLAISV